MAKNRGVYKSRKRGKELRRQEKQERKRQRRFGKRNGEQEVERSGAEPEDSADLVLYLISSVTYYYTAWA